MSSINSKAKVTLKTLEALKAKGERFACVTTYDSTFAQIASNVGIEVLLVGDTLGMVIQGHDSTLPVTMEDILYHLEAVQRGNIGSLIMGDMHDMLGITPPDIKVPKFVKNFLAESDDGIRGAFAAYARAVKDGSFPGPEHSY